MASQTLYTSSRRGLLMVDTITPPPPVPRNHIAQEPFPGYAVEFSHHFFFIYGIGFFMVFGGCRTAVKVCRTTFHLSFTVCSICFCTTSCFPCYVP